ncbi:tail tape measure protein [Weissella phage PWc]|nr:tail tape measure protein [Weissella phage PWc]
MAENYTLSTTLIANTQAYINSMKQADKANKDVEQSAQKTEGSTGKFGKALAGSMAIGGAAVTALGVKSLKSFGDFEQGLNTAAIIAGGTSKDIEGLSDVALKMGQDLPLSAQDSANAMIEMARNGASVEELKKVFPAIAMASTAAGADLTATAGVVQQAMNVWGNSLESPEQAAALLTQTANLSNASVESMQQALATLGPTAVRSGMSLSDTSTAVGLLTNTGTSSAEAAQQLRHAMLQMQAPSNKAADAMDELGLSYRKADGSMKPFTQIAKETSKALDGVGKSERDAYMKALFHTSGMQAMDTVMKSVNDTSGDAKTSWDAYTKAMDAAGGSTEKANEYLNQQAYDMQNNVGAKIEQVGGAWDTFSMKSMAGSKGLSTAVLSMTADTIDYAANSDSALGKAARGFMGLSPVIGTAMTASSGFIVQAKNIGGALASVTKGTVSAIGGIGRFAGKLLPFGKSAGDAAKKTEQMSGATSKSGKSAQGASPKLMGIAKATMQIGVGVGAATAGIGIMALGIAQLAKTGDKGVIATVALAGSIAVVTAVVGAFAPVLQASQGGLLALAAVMLSFGAGVAMAAAGIGAMSAGIALLITAFTGLTAVASQIVPTMAAIGTGGAMMIGNFVTVLLGYVPVIIELFGQIMRGILQTIINNAPLIGEAFSVMLVTMIGVITVNLPKIIQMFTQMFIQILEGMAQNAPAIINAWTDLIVNILKGLADNMPRFAKAGTDLIVSFLEGITKNFDRVAKAGVDLIVKVLGGIGDNIDRLITAGIELVGKFLMGIANNLYKVYNEGKQVVLKVIEGIGQIIGDMMSSGGQILDAFVRGFQKGFNKANKSGKGAGNETKDGAGSISLDSVGGWLMQGLLNGITGKARELYNTAAGIANNIKNTISSALHIGSPSKDMIRIGAWTTEGLAIGIDKEKKLVSRASSDIAELARIEPIQYSSNFDTPRGVDMRNTNDLNISLDQQEVKPAMVNLSLGGRDFTAFVQDISTEFGAQARLSNGNSVY